MPANELVCDLERLLGKTGPIERTETSKSWVFVTPQHVFKLKKPVRDTLQDLTSLRARHDNTLTEIDLNRRLAPDLYLGAVRVGRLPSGGLALDRPDCETVDWLVHMRRLNGDQMLNAQIAADMPQARIAKSLDALVPRLTAFYRKADVSRLTAAELMTVQEDQLAMTREVLLDPQFAMHHSRIERVLRKLVGIWPSITEMLAERVRSGGIVEGHGDLRPEHICLSDPPVIYDCLEFNRTLRLSDPYSEVVFLGMECAMLGAGWVGPWMIEALEEGLGPAPKEALLQVYEVFHAIVRARLCFAHLLQPVPRTPEKWIPLGLRYLNLAERRLN